MEINICLERKLPKDTPHDPVVAIERAMEFVETEFMEMFGSDYDPDRVELSLYWQWKKERWEFIAKYDHDAVEDAELIPDGDFKEAMGLPTWPQPPKLGDHELVGVSSGGTRERPFA